MTENRVEYVCVVCGEITRRREGEIPPAECPYCDAPMNSDIIEIRDMMIAKRRSEDGDE